MRYKKPSTCSMLLWSVQQSSVYKSERNEEADVPCVFLRVMHRQA